MSNLAQDRMKEDYETRGGFYFLPLRDRIKCAAEQGLLIFIKYSLVLILAFFALQFLTSIVSGSTNGTQAALYLQELQNKGYLPKVVNGAIPSRNESNATPDIK